jgi:hypothetical protein
MRGYSKNQVGAIALPIERSTVFRHSPVRWKTMAKYMEAAMQKPELRRPLSLPRPAHRVMPNPRRPPQPRRNKWSFAFLSSSFPPPRLSAPSPRSHSAAVNCRNYLEEPFSNRRRGSRCPSQRLRAHPYVIAQAQHGDKSLLSIRFLIINSFPR